MANPYRGEVNLQAGDKTYTLVYTINALCDVEEANPGVNILSDFSKISNIRLMALAGLKKYHPEITKANVGDLLQEVGLEEAKIAISEAIARAFPPKDKTANPQ